MKKKNRILTTMFAFVCAFVLMTSIAIGTVGVQEQTVGGEVFALTGDENTDRVKDEDGNLLIPFDLAYPEVFDLGNHEYAEDAVLLKMDGNVNGALRSRLTANGVKELTEVTPSSDGYVWYRAQLSSDNAKSAIAKLRKVEGVVMADFDYIYRSEAIESDAIETYASTNIADEVKDNELVSNQWHLDSSKIQESWKFLKDKGIAAGGDSSVVVAVIDTGVDYTHPDLKDNMWINQGEIPGNGRDDDGNGYVDDVYGVNVIAGKGDPADDHGHGTHVAGIIAASNNKEGVVGIAYNVKIMAVKAGQATGVFTQSDIAAAILYAYENGADVINMSFGGSACSIAVQDALTTAYTRCTLVASAGNDGAPNEGTDFYPPLPNYPAALSYVIGVMSVDQYGVESYFTNWDVYGFNTIEYEMYAPGESIMSTLPGGRYGYLSGTSMAAPIVSASAALLRSYYTDRDMYPSKFIMAQLVSTSETSVTCIDPQMHTVNKRPHNLPMRLDLYKAFTTLPKPELYMYDYYLFDDKSFGENNSGDGVVDAGETIGIAAVVRNRWGMSENTNLEIDALSNLGVANPYVEIIDAKSYFDSVGTYSTKDKLVRTNDNIITGVEDPFIVKIKDDCPNDYRIILNVTITYINALDKTDMEQYKSKGTIEFIVRSGTILQGQITKDMTLTKDRLYIVPNSLYIPEGVTVTAQPGTRIQFWTDDPQDPYADTYMAFLTVAGKFITNGTVDEPVELFPSEFMSDYRVEIKTQDNGIAELNYTTVTNPYLRITTADHCTFKQNYVRAYRYRILSNGRVSTGDSYGYINAIVTNSIFYKLGTSNYYKMRLSGNYDNCTFVDSAIDFSYDRPSYSNCVFMGNNIVDDRGDIGNSSITLTPLAKLGVYSIDYNSQSKTTYLTLNFEDNAPIYKIGVYRALAQKLGGDFACIETKEELDFLNARYIYGWIGLQNGAKTWVNGAPIGEFISIVNGQFPYGYFMSGAGNIRFDTSWVDRVIFEIPGNITEEDFYSVQDEWIEKVLNNPGFANNAILNDFNDTNVEHWLRIVARDGNNSQKIGLAGTYWGTTNEELIERQILDFDDFQTLQDINPYPYLTEAPENVWPFVTDAYLLNAKNERVRKVSNEKVTFVVEFNRDMDTSVPLRVRFGSSEPFAEYEISGSYVNPRRWEGTYTLKTTIENGNQFIRIENGRAKDDHFLALYEHAGRFSFEIDTTAAQALIMRAEATAEGIKLTWDQDDFATLAGYNVYRSTKEDGYYERINKYVIPADTKEFFDDTIEPGVRYYYNFTVVQTDFTESTPSGKISVMSFDTMAPDIYHSPVRTAFTGSNLVVSALITDNLQIVSATLYYRTKGGAWKQTAMSANNSRYSGIIPSSDITTAGLEYYISVSDGNNISMVGSKDNPYEVTVKLAVDKNSLGDVDGDGVITSKDALMLLQAANDLLNLTAEQFLRADINGDGELSASEALIILQYVSGKRTTITG